MEAITVRELLSKCGELIKAGFGDKKILLTNDDEWNGYHELFDGFFTTTGDATGLWPVPMAKQGTFSEFANDLYDVLGMNTDFCTQQEFFDEYVRDDNSFQIDEFTDHTTIWFDDVKVTVEPI